MSRYSDLPVFVDDEEIDGLFEEVMADAAATHPFETLDAISELLTRKTEIYRRFSARQHAVIERWLADEWNERDVDFFELAAGLVVGGRMEQLFPRLELAKQSENEQIRALAEELIAEWKEHYE